MKVRSSLEEASIESITNADELLLTSDQKLSGRFYFNRETSEMLVADGDGLLRFRPRSSLGEIVQSFLAEAQYQQESGDAWVLCRGQSIDDTDDYATYVTRSTDPVPFALEVVGDLASDPGVDIVYKYYIEADNVGGASLTLPEADGEKNLPTLISEWNDANPLNEVQLLNTIGQNSKLFMPDGVTELTPAELQDFRPEVFSTFELKAFLPDLRGMFLRGHNEFREDGLENPDDTEIGKYQESENKAHSHSFRKRSATQNITGSEPPSNANGQPHNQETTSQGVSESRPRSITVNHFIKINR